MNGTIRKLPALHCRSGAWLLCVVMALAACSSEGPEGAFYQYLKRLGNTLAVEAPPGQPATVPRLPRAARLRIELPSSSLDTLDFLALSGCEVQITIGKRNSSLGRMATASQGVLLDLEYLRLAPACIEHLQNDGERELADQLQSAWALKREQLPARLFLATLGGPEFRRFWRPPARLDDYPARTSSAVATALEAILADVRRWLRGDYRADGSAFELNLGKVRQGDGGALLQALAIQSTWLASADALLDSKAAAGPLCTDLLRPGTADILPNVVRLFFVGEIQPWLAAVEQRRYALLPAVTALESTLADALPPAYEDWRKAREAAIAHWQAAPRQHVQAVQDLLAPCGGISPPAT